MAPAAAAWEQCSIQSESLQQQSCFMTNSTFKASLFRLGFVHSKSSDQVRLKPRDLIGSWPFSYYLQNRVPPVSSRSFFLQAS